MAPSPLLVARGLCKSYEGSRVVDGLDLHCDAGTVLGLLGPNGAGKTTTLRMLYGFIEPDAGEIRYGAKPFAAHRSACKRMIGVCAQEDTLDHDFSVERNLRVYATYFRPRRADIDKRIAHLLDLFGLTAHAHQLPAQLSGGFKRRLMIARSLVHEPQVLFLDEPTTGLDPAARVEVWQLIARLREQGLAIILTTHYMDEAERLSDQCLILSAGKAVAQGAPRELLGTILGEHVAIVPAAQIEPGALERWALAELGAAPARVLHDWHVPLTAAQLVAFSVQFPDARFAVRDPTLEDLFLQLSAGGPAARPRTP